MLGLTHAATGAAAGAATLPIAPVHSLPLQLAWTVSWIGAALIPDLDQGSVSLRKGFKVSGSTAARLWGPITAITARFIGWVARGHRQGTHDIILAPVVFGGLTFFAAAHYWSALIVLALVVGLAVQACNKLIPGNLEKWWPINLIASFVIALQIQAHHVDVSWLPWAVAGGCIVHILGDALTTAKVPVPFTWMTQHKWRWGLPLASTSSWLEPVATTLAVLVTVWQITVNTGLIL